MSLMKEPKITALLFTLNEEENLRRLLPSIKDFVDDIVIIDSCSDDNTAEVAKNYSAKIYFAKRFGYVEPLRMYGISKVNTEWILYIDADDFLSPILIKDLKKIIKQADNVGAGAIIIRRKTKFRNKLLRIYDKYIPIYKKNSVLYKGIIHEYPLIKGKIIDLSDNKNYYYVLTTSTRIFLKKMKKYMRFEKTDFIPFVPSIFSLYKNKKVPKFLEIFFIPFYLPSFYLFYVLTKKDLLIPFLVAMYSTFRRIIALLRGKKYDKLAELLNNVGSIKLLQLDEEKNISTDCKSNKIYNISKELKKIIEKM